MLKIFVFMIMRYELENNTASLERETPTWVF